MPLKTRIADSCRWFREIGVDEHGVVSHACDDTQVHPLIAEFVRRFLPPVNSCELVVLYDRSLEIAEADRFGPRECYDERELDRAYLLLDGDVQINLPPDLAAFVWVWYAIEYEQE